MTETFSLQHLIGCDPMAVLLPFSFCVMRYKVMQRVRAFVAGEGCALAATVSTHCLFDDPRRQPQA